MTKEEHNFIKDAFSQIIDDIAGNPDWGDAAKAVASDLGTLERKLEKRVTELPSNLDEAAEEYEHNLGYYECVNQWPSVAFKAGAEWMAERGDVIATRLVIDSEGKANLNFTIGDITDENCKPKYYTGQDVIVQIRKK